MKETKNVVFSENEFDKAYEHFKGLIIHYARKLNPRLYNFQDSDDVESDLTLFLLDLIKQGVGMKGSRYLSVAIRNRFIAISKSSCEKSKMENLLSDQDWVDYVDYNEYKIQKNKSLNSEDLCLDSIFKMEISHTLKIHCSDKQIRVFTLKFYYGYSDVEIGNMLGISRQAVNRMLNRVLKIFKEQMCIQRRTA